MIALFLAALFFIAIHLGVAGTQLRDRAVAAVGERGYRAIFSLASIAGLIWLIIAYNHAAYIATWGLLLWWKPLAILSMLPATLFVVIGLITPNPTAVAQEDRLAQAPRGIVRITRHPFLMGVAIWALVHVIGNGDVASLIFFGTWAVVALAGPGSIDAKRRRAAPEAWARFAAETSILPFAAIIAGRNHLALAEIGTRRWALGLLVYALLLGGHGPVIGVPLLPT